MPASLAACARFMPSRALAIASARKAARRLLGARAGGPGAPARKNSFPPPAGITHAMTTVATVHEARCTAAIHRALADKGLAPGEHLVDAAYVDAELLVRSREEHGIELVGPPRGNPSWQTKTEGGYTIDRFEVDWDTERVGCPQG